MILTLEFPLVCLGLSLGLSRSRSRCRRPPRQLHISKVFGEPADGGTRQFALGFFYQRYQKFRARSDEFARGDDAAEDHEPQDGETVLAFRRQCFVNPANSVVIVQGRRTCLGTVPIEHRLLGLQSEIHGAGRHHHGMSEHPDRLISLFVAGRANEGTGWVF